MSGKKRATRRKLEPTGSNLKKIDDYELGAADYAEIPELTEDWFRKATLHIGGVPVRRGRPKSSQSKRAVSLRLDPDVLAHYRRGGPGWQTRINAILRKAAKLPTAKKKA